MICTTRPIQKPSTGPETVFTLTLLCLPMLDLASMPGVLLQTISLFFFFVITISLLFTRHCKTEIWGQCRNFNILSFKPFCDTVRCPILGSARVEICILKVEIRQDDLGLIRLQELTNFSLMSYLGISQVF